MQSKETKVAEHPVRDEDGLRATVVESATYVLLPNNGMPAWAPNGMRAYRLGSATLEPTEDGTGFRQHSNGRVWLHA